MSSELMTEPAIKTDSLQVFRADALEMLPTLPTGSIHCVITDPPYESMNKHREIGTTTRLGGHHDPEKRTGWFDTLTNEELFDVLCEFARLLPRHGHAWVMADNETQAIIQGFVREGDTGFDYVKSYPLIKLRTDGQAPKMGGGYHLKATHEYVVLCEKGRRQWAPTKAEHLAKNNRPDYFMVPWTGAAETRPLTADGKPYPTAKPMNLYRELIQLSSSEGETVLDPFAGSGPCAQAALIEKRKAVLIDKSAGAVEVIRRRSDPERTRLALAAIERELGLSELRGAAGEVHVTRDADPRTRGSLFDIG